MSVKHYPAWQTVKIGCFGSAGVACEELRRAEIKIEPRAKDILGRINFQDTERPLDLARVSVNELRLKDLSTTKSIYVAAKGAGLSLCPPEVGPSLLLQYYKNMALNEWMTIAMETIKDSYNCSIVFTLEHTYEGRKLGIQYGDPTYRWSSRCRFVFVK